MSMQFTPQEVGALINEIGRLRAENEELRAALQQRDQPHAAYVAGDEQRYAHVANQC